MPYQSGLKMFNFNRPCTTCGHGTPFELNGVRICGYDYVRLRKQK